MALLSGSLGVSIGDTCVVSSKKLKKNYGIGMWTENKWNIRAKKRPKRSETFLQGQKWILSKIKDY